MTHASRPDIAVSTERLRRRARERAQALLRDRGGQRGLAVRVRVSGPSEPAAGLAGFPAVEPVSWRADAEGVTLRICAADPDGLADEALEGGLALALSEFHASRRPGAHAFHFQRRILHTFSVTGSAVQVIRRLVRHLEDALKRAEAVDDCCARGQAGNLGRYFFHWVTPSTPARRHYERAFPHAWMRGLFLARMSEAFVPLTRLDARTAASGLRPFWWDCHPWLLPEDRRTLDALAAVAGRDDLPTFADRVTAAFAVLQRRLLGAAPGEGKPDG